MALEFLDTCPLCENTQFSPYLQVEDYTVSHGTFQIVRCQKCAFLFTNPRPSSGTIGEYYESNEYISHHDDNSSILAKTYNQVRKLTTRQKIGILNAYICKQEKRVLDIGCGTGFFLGECKSAGWDIYGTEPDDDARAAATRKTGTEIHPSIHSAELQSSQFPMITLWHVLEHIHDLNGTLSWLERHLHPKGTLIIAVPNPESFDAKKYKKFWAAYDVPRHLYHFTKGSMEKLLNRHHFQLLEIKNMLFDAYYVSLLSTRYQSGKNNYIDSLLTGTLSNLKGCSSSNNTINTSSLIYIAKKK